MAKSKGNFYRILDIEDKGFDPLVLRYFYLTAQYQTFLNFTWEGMTAAKNSLTELRNHMRSFRADGRNVLSGEKMEKIDAYRQKFDSAIANDLNTPQALAVVWEVVKSNIPSQDKYDLLTDFDEVLGLQLGRTEEIPADIQALATKRDQLRREHQFVSADTIRKDIESKGFVVEDTPQGGRITKA